jgi:hypothetical protein
MAVRRKVIPLQVKPLQLAEQYQDQKDYHHEAESAAPVIAGPIEGAAADTAEATQEDDDQDDQQDRSNGHGLSPRSSNEMGMHLVATQSRRPYRRDYA